MRSNNPQSHLILWHYTFYIECVAEQLPFLAALYCSKLSIPTPPHSVLSSCSLFPVLISTLQTVALCLLPCYLPYPYRRFANHHNQAFLFKTINYSHFLNTLRGGRTGSTDHRLQVLLPADVQTHRCENRTCVARAHRASFRRGCLCQEMSNFFLAGLASWNMGIPNQMCGNRRPPYQFRVEQRLDVLLVVVWMHIDESLCILLMIYIPRLYP